MVAVDFIKKLVVFLIKIYQLLISPIISFNKCRFYPSCSDYMIEAIEVHGLVKGIYWGSIRVLSCHPFSKKGKCGGYDPVRPSNKKVSGKSEE